MPQETSSPSVEVIEGDDSMQEVLDKKKPAEATFHDDQEPVNPEVVPEQSLLDVALIEYARDRAAKELAKNPGMTEQKAFNFGVAMALKSVDELVGKNYKKARESLPKKLAPADSQGVFDQEVRDQLNLEISKIVDKVKNDRKAMTAKLNEVKSKIYKAGPGQAFETFGKTADVQEAADKQGFSWQKLTNSLGMNPKDMHRVVDEYANVPHDERQEWVSKWLKERSDLFTPIDSLEDYRANFDELLAHRSQLPLFERQEQARQEPEWLKKVRLLELDPATVRDFLNAYESHPEDKRQGYTEEFVNKIMQDRYPQRPPHDIDDIDDIARTTYRQAAEDLGKRRDEVPKDFDILQKMLSENYKEDEQHELGDTGVIVRLQQKLRNVGQAIWNAPLDMVVNAQTRLNSFFINMNNKDASMTPDKAEQLLKIRRRAAIVLLGASVLILSRTVARTMPSVDQLLDMVGFGSGDVDAGTRVSAGSPEASPTGGELPEAPPPGENVDKSTPTPAVELYKPKGDSWWEIAEELLKDAKKSGDIDSLDSSKRHAVMDALQEANPDGIKQQGMDIRSALAEIETMKAEDAIAAQKIEASTTIYEAQRGDTITKIADRLLEARGINNPNPSLRSEVEQSLIDNNYTYNGSAHWIDQGENMHLRGAQEVISDFLNPEPAGGGVGETVGDDGGNLPTSTEEAPAPASNTQTGGAESAASAGTFTEALASVGDRVNANEVVPNITPGQDWNAVLRNVGISGAVGAAILIKIGPQLVRGGFAEKIATFDRYVVGRKPITRSIINAIQQMALKITRR